MYVKKTLIEHEMNQIKALNKDSAKELIEKGKIKLETLHNLEIIETHEYINELDRLSMLDAKPKKK